MKHLNLFFALLLSTTLFASTEEGNGRINYIIKPDFLSVGLAAEFISRGYPLGQEQLLPEIVTPGIDNIGELFEAKSKEYTAQTETTVKLANSELMISEESTSGESSITQELYQLNLTKYFSCIEEVAPVFFKAFSIQKQVYLDESEKLELLKGLNTKLDHDRGLMGRNSLEGHICGKYLGKLGFFKLQDIQLYKYLSVMASLEDTEKIKVLAAVIATQHPDTPMVDKLTFLKLLNYQMARIHFKKLQGLDLNEIKGQYHTILTEVAYTQEKEGVHITHTPLNQWPQIEIAFNWALGQLAL